MRGLFPLVALSFSGCLVFADYEPYACTRDWDCDGDDICLDRVCAPAECDDTVSCAGGLECNVWGRCVECFIDQQCPGSERCSDEGVCL